MKCWIILQPLLKLNKVTIYKYTSNLYRDIYIYICVVPRQSLTGHFLYLHAVHFFMPCQIQHHNIKKAQVSIWDLNFDSIWKW